MASIVCKCVVHGRTAFLYRGQVDEGEGTQYIGIFVLQAAPRSPDLTVTVYLWTLLDTALGGRVFNSIKHLSAAVRKAWETISVWTGRALAASMAAPVEKVIQNDGGQVERNIYIYTSGFTCVAKFGQATALCLSCTMTRKLLQQCSAWLLSRLQNNTQTLAVTGSAFPACASSSPPMQFQILAGIDGELQMQPC